MTFNIHNEPRTPSSAEKAIGIACLVMGAVSLIESLRSMRIFTANDPPGRLAHMCGAIITGGAELHYYDLLGEVVLRSIILTVMGAALVLMGGSSLFNRAAPPPLPLFANLSLILLLIFEIWLVMRSWHPADIYYSAGLFLASIHGIYFIGAERNDHQQKRHSSRFLVFLLSLTAMAILGHIILSVFVAHKFARQFIEQ